MIAQITHKMIVTNLNTNESVITRFDFSDYKMQSPAKWDEYALAIMQLTADSIANKQTKVEIVTVSEEA